jgi:hypothetical protein
MNINHDDLERLAREICDSRNGVGHYDAKGTKRAIWRDHARRKMEAAEVNRSRGIGTLDALMAIFCMKRVSK